PASPSNTCRAPNPCRFPSGEYVHHRALHSFPTRRSSDLNARSRQDGPVTAAGLGRVGRRRGIAAPQTRNETRLDHADADIYREGDRKSTRLNSSHVKISYAVFCLKKKMKKIIRANKDAVL